VNTSVLRISAKRDSIGSELGEKAKKSDGFILINRMFVGFYCEGYSRVNTGFNYLGYEGG